MLERGLRLSQEGMLLCLLVMASSLPERYLPDYVYAEQYEGEREGYRFANGPDGLGYYRLAAAAGDGERF